MLCLFYCILGAQRNLNWCVKAEKWGRKLKIKRRYFVSMFPTPQYLQSFVIDKAARLFPRDCLQNSSSASFGGLQGVPASEVNFSSQIQRLKFSFCIRRCHCFPVGQLLGRYVHRSTVVRIEATVDWTFVICFSKIMFNTRRHSAGSVFFVGATGSLFELRILAQQQPLHYLGVSKY